MNASRIVSFAATTSCQDLLMLLIIETNVCYFLLAFTFRQSSKDGWAGAIAVDGANVLLQDQSVSSSESVPMPTSLLLHKIVDPVGVVHVAALSR